MVMKLESTVLDKYLYEITKDEFHRYRSWDNCFKYFSENKKTENHCLQLGFYLASWGMYRGSSGLLQKNHLIHDKAISIIFKSKYDRLRCNKEQEVDEKTILLLLELKK